MGVEEAIYEGYGPGGIAILVETLTDNKNRTTSEIRHIFEKSGGSLGESGCVAWMFHKKGYIGVDKGAIDEDRLLDIVLEAGGEDMSVEDTTYDITTDPHDFESMVAALEKEGIKPIYKEITMIPSTYIKVDGKVARSLMSLVEALNEQEDVQQVYANFDIPDDLSDEGG